MNFLHLLISYEYSIIYYNRPSITHLNICYLDWTTFFNFIFLLTFGSTLFKVMGKAIHPTPKPIISVRIPKTPQAPADLGPKDSSTLLPSLLTDFKLIGIMEFSGHFSGTYLKFQFNLKQL